MPKKDPAGRSGTLPRIEDFDYALPPELVAQRPLERRDAARLLVVDRRTGSLVDDVFSNIPGHFGPGDALVLNDTKVFPARLEGRKATGGRVEALLVGESEGDPRVWRVLLQPSLKEGQEVFFGESGVRGTFRGRDLDGMALMAFDAEDVRSLARESGRMPLPPYIRRDPDARDEKDYQTVYAAAEGAVAAPTAGLHFTRELLERIMQRGVTVLTVTLHVGYGTFRPVRDIATHRMHAEAFRLRPEVADALNRVRAEGRRIWAVGTTAVRALETCTAGGRVVPGEGETDLFLYPPAEFEVASGLVTNFHLPRSTLLMLVGAFMGLDLMRRAYAHAVRQSYRFYSYGDSMLIL